MADANTFVQSNAPHPRNKHNTRQNEEHKRIEQRKNMKINGGT